MERWEEGNLPHNAGEPLLHPQLRDIFLAMRPFKERHGTRFVLYTNGMLLNENRSRDIHETDVVEEIHFSIDGYGDKESGEYMRPGSRWDNLW